MQSLVVLSAGSNDCGQLGVPRVADASVPAGDDESERDHHAWFRALPDSGSLIDTNSISSLVAGANSSSALVGGMLYVWGLDTEGGHGDGRAHPTRPELPRRMQALEGHSLVQVALGEEHHIVLTTDHRVFTFGSGDYGQLGRGAGTLSSAVPKRVKSLPPSDLAVAVAAGQFFSLILTDSGTVYGFGDNAFGQLGLGHQNSEFEPRRVSFPDGVGVVQIACGARHCLALDSDGVVWAWGANSRGQLGLGGATASAGGAGTGVSASTGGAATMVRVPVQLNRFAVGAQIAKVTAGAYFSLALATDGEVYAWGAGASGQLGQGDLNERALPSRIRQLSGRKVLDVAAGERFAFATDRDGVVWAWGNNECAQLFLPAREFIEYPTRVPALSAPGTRLRRLACGTAHAVALCAVGDVAAAGPATVSEAPEQYADGLYSLRAVSWDRFQRLIETRADGSSSSSSSSARAALASYVTAAFSAPGPLNASFVRDGKFDASVAHTFYEAVFADLADTELANTIFAAVLKQARAALKVVSDAPPSSLRALQLVAVGLAVGAVTRPAESFESAAAALFRVLASLPPRPRDAIVASMATYPHHTLAQLVSLAQLFVHHFFRTGAALEPLLDAIGLLALVRDANTAASSPLPRTSFWVTALDAKSDFVFRHYNAWAHARASHTVLGAKSFNVLRWPWMLSSATKAALLQREALTIQSAAVHRAFAASLFQGIIAEPQLVLRVRRSALLADAMTQSLSQPESLQFPLTVVFEGEDGVDAGGPRKELFELLATAFCAREYSMLALADDSHKFYFNAGGFAGADEIAFLGTALGLALYNGVPFPLPLARAAFRALLAPSLDAIAPTLSDLADLHPELAAGLEALLRFDGDVENTFVRTFEADIERVDGSRLVVPLVPGGSERAVTAANRDEYVRALVAFTLVDSVREQLTAFRRGFELVTKSDVLRLFTDEDLELAVCGESALDFVALERAAAYRSGYTAEHPTIRALWRYLHALDEQTKRKFLWFVSGSRRAPVGGLGKLTMTVDRSGAPGPDEPLRLPQVSTCFVYLVLPDYADETALRNAMDLALSGCEGFALR